MRPSKCDTGIDRPVIRDARRVSADVRRNARWSLRMNEFRYTCAVCGNEHVGLPAFGAPAPALYSSIPEVEREKRCALGTDDCIVDGEHFFIRALL